MCRGEHKWYESIGKYEEYQQYDRLVFQSASLWSNPVKAAAMRAALATSPTFCRNSQGMTGSHFKRSSYDSQHANKRYSHLSGEG